MEITTGYCEKSYELCGQNAEFIIFEHVVHIATTVLERLNDAVRSQPGQHLTIRCSLCGTEKDTWVKDGRGNREVEKTTTRTLTRTNPP